jgi:hypothetical protein
MVVNHDRYQHNKKNRYQGIVLGILRMKTRLTIKYKTNPVHNNLVSCQVLFLLHPIIKTGNTSLVEILSILCQLSLIVDEIMYNLEKNLPYEMPTNWRTPLHFVQASSTNEYWAFPACSVRRAFDH